MSSLSIGKAWDQSVKFLGREARLVLAVSLALLVLPSVLLGVVAPQTFSGTPPEGMTGLLWLLAVLIALAGRLAIMRLALGPSASVREAIGQGFKRLPAAFAAILIFVVPITLIAAPILPPIMASPGNPPAREASLFLLLCVAAFVAGARLVVLAMPLAVAEKLNPFVLLKRSWTLTKGHWWRLMGFLLVYFIAAGIALRAAMFVISPLLVLLTGEIEPLTLSALILAIVMSSVSAVFDVILSIMQARMYAQLTAPVSTVPEVERTVE